MRECRQQIAVDPLVGCVLDVEGGHTVEYRVGCLRVVQASECMETARAARQGQREVAFLRVVRVVEG